MIGDLSDTDSVPLTIRTPAKIVAASAVPAAGLRSYRSGWGVQSICPTRGRRWAAGKPEQRTRACAERGGRPRGRREVVSAEASTRGPGRAQPCSPKLSPSAAVAVALDAVVPAAEPRAPPQGGSGAAAAAVRGRPVFRGPARWLPARRVQPAWEEGSGSRPAGRRSREETMSERRPQFSTTERVIKGAERAAGNGPRRAMARGLEERGWRQRREALQGAGRTGRPSAGVPSDCWTGT